jgi:stage 0 sporulation protein B (sporulation initiation phosphotransferase)
MNRNLSSEREQSMEIRDLMEESLEVLRIYRHDLMNQVQLLQAYSQMKKFDRLQEPIQSLVAEAQRHTEWSSFPSTILSYIVLSRDIRYPMLQLHVSYEQSEESSLEAEMVAARVLSDLLDGLGDESKSVLEPISVDIWIVALRNGYEIGWLVSNEDAKSQKTLGQTWAEKWVAQGLECRQEQAEDGIEYVLRILV